MSKKLEPGMAFDTGKLNKIFAILSVIFFMVVIWVFLDDYLRPWKKYQIEAQQIKRTHIQQQIDEETKNIDPAKMKELEAKLVEGNKQVEANAKEIKDIEKKISKIKDGLQENNIKSGELNAVVSALNFNYEQAYAHHDPKTSKMLAKLNALKGQFAIVKDQIKALDAEQKNAEENLAKLKETKLAAEKEIDATTKKLTLLKKGHEQTDQGIIFAIRNAPFIDYLDPTLKINQIVLNNITDDRYFRSVYKVDRCTTCHTFIDQPGFEKEANPHKTHPKLDLMIGMNSPHPMKQIGCTVCHGGEGHRVTDFSAAAHTPENDKQEIEWIKKYNWKEGHKVAQPMLKKSQTEGSCLKCHTGSNYVAGAPILNEGIKNINKYGCYGCHKIDGLEQAHKAGPSLLKISGKVNKEFFKNWVWDPKSFNSHARMPSFFGQDNNKTPEFMKKNIAEVNAIAEVVYAQSKTYTPFANYKGGNAEKGKELLKAVGCMGCHGVEGLDEESKKVKPFKATYLTGTGSKLTPDFIYSWIKKPNHYQEDTIMPSFRLSDQEANDITAYLVSLKNAKFDRLKFQDLDKKVRDELLVQYLSAFDTEASAKEKVAKMSDEEKTMDLGKRSIGKYGCYSCHNIEGFEGRGPIGPELYKIGAKPVAQMGFGTDHSIPHKRDAWIEAHLQNPRRWDVGVDKAFKDLLLMPNLNMSKEEAKSITVALLGMTGEKIPYEGGKKDNAGEMLFRKTQKIYQKYNCIGCHKVDGTGGYVLAMYDDANESAPQLNNQGHRVQVPWFHNFLENVHPIRPWVKLRMPTYNFTNEEKNTLIEGWQMKAGQVTFEKIDETLTWEPGEKEAGKLLFEKFNCTSCHTPGFNQNPAMGPDLHYVKTRLRPSWVEKWLANPQAIIDTSTMPAFWPNEKSDQAPEILGGDSKKQIRAVTKYLFLELGKNGYPAPSAK